MGSKHGKYIYVERRDGWYVKIRVLNIRLRKKGKEKFSFDINDPLKYIVLRSKTRNPPYNADILREDDIPIEVREKIYSI